jgi:hypothetical protein
LRPRAWAANSSRDEKKWRHAGPRRGGDEGLLHPPFARLDDDQSFRSPLLPLGPREAREQGGGERGRLRGAG